MDDTAYMEMIRSKVNAFDGIGFETGDISPLLFDWQSAIVGWATRKGRCALFEDCGLGKTAQQLEWARLVSENEGGPVLVFAPLAVSTQTVREGEKFGIASRVVASSDEIDGPGIYITNYHKLHRFTPGGLVGLVLDESSILKGYDAKTRKALTDFAEQIPYRLACTATPSPNDFDELTRHAEFLGIMQEKESKALFFTQDGNSTTNWRLKKHAVDQFWKWIASWAIAIRNPSDLGYEDVGFTLPALDIRQHTVHSDGNREGLFGEVVLAETLSERRAARRASLDDRVRMAAEIANSNDDPILIWCDLNAESAALTKAINGAVEIKGSDSPEHKESAMLGFSDGSVRCLVTKPSIAGWGLNWQHCNRMVFVGLSDSYEAFYQAVRRCWRFGQKRPVTAHIVTAEAEGAVVQNVQRKEKQAMEMYEEVSKHVMASNTARKSVGREEYHYHEDVQTGDGWTMYLGDSVLTVNQLEDASVGLSVFSPPFPGMYMYTNSVHDMGNVADIQQMIDQFEVLMGRLIPKMMPGRTCAIHLTQATKKMAIDGASGLKDFRGAVIAMMESIGWIYYGEACIDKNPQVKAIRTKDHGLMFKSLASDSAKMHMALADYLLQFRAPGDNPSPIRAGISKRYGNEDGWITSEEWILWARPVWYASDYAPNECEVHDGIAETDVLNVSAARSEKDERHLCPLQLGVIERAVKLWSAPGELVYSPFGGVGSEGFVAVKLGRQFVGCELKRSYWDQACRNMERAVAERRKLTLF